MPDGSFKREAQDDSIEEGVYYGVSFLCRIGYFKASERFWTQQDFPDAASIRQKIVDYILVHKSSGGAGGTYYNQALRQLN